MISGLIGKWMKLSMAETTDLVISGFLHDIGKAKVPTDILNKPERLTAEEMAVMRKHTVYGYELVQKTADVSDRIYRDNLTPFEAMEIISQQQFGSLDTSISEIF
ncbi:hypothetical protein skT53_11820 [Effusibacillus dendaii]|uniref:HD-GYP domain-containing protein n=2 Tax=Effusibacillus dendaii TaxID=2743772 RepID=A0A7I8D856_9BACL|nr:hypothetical protein skT53_11820 [Effusibacillus dendaii]